ncbi:MAG: glycosyl transferase [Rhodospirillaceae bacterium]|nr:glycosyl transferase [Rhodospirillaceae bacterium]|tara:strand:+ start:1093 stop:2058 length:966 start_codon:yes stop_codon:yes gene_type:complete
MRILFITSSRVGDAILTTGLLKYLVDRYSDAKFTIACGPVAQGLFDHVPRLEKVIVLRKGFAMAHWRHLLKSTMIRSWHTVVDMRSSATSWFLPTLYRRIYTRKDKNAHRVDDMRHTLSLDTAPNPHIWLDSTNRTFADSLLIDKGQRPLLVVGPTANWAAKIWPAAYFSELISRLTAEDGCLAGGSVVVVGGPGEETIAAPILNMIPAERRIDLVGPIPFLDVAAVLERASLYVGNDSGLMHLSAAVGAPTLGLFGPTREYNYRPWGALCGFVRTDETHAELSTHPDFRPDPTNSLMLGLSVEKVISASTELLELSKRLD